MGRYDLVIVGAESAGRALAGRLTERVDLRIRMIEAEPTTPPNDAPDTTGSAAA